MIQRMARMMRIKPSIDPIVIPRTLKFTAGTSSSSFCASAFDVDVGFTAEIEVVDAISAVVVELSA